MAFSLVEGVMQQDTVEKRLIPIARLQTLNADPSASADAMARALGTDADSPELWSCLVWAKLLLRDSDGALESLVRAEACGADREEAEWQEHGILWRALRASALYVSGERKAAAALAEATLCEAVRHGLAEAVGRCELVLGNYKTFHGDSAEAEQHLAAAKERFKALGDERIWVIAELNALICVFNRGACMEIIERAMSLTRHNEIRRNPDLRAVVTSHLAMAYGSLGEDEESLKYRHESLRLCESIPRSPGLGIGCFCLSHTYNALGNFEQARFFLAKLFRLPQECLEPGLLTAGRLLEATVALEAGDAVAARVLADAVDPCADPHCRVQIRVDHAVLRMRLFAAEQNPGEAVDAGLEGYRLAVDSGNDQKLIELLEYLGDVLRAFPGAVPQVAKRVRTVLNERIQDAPGETGEELATHVYAAAVARAAEACNRTACRLRRKLGRALAAQGRHAEACAEFERCLDDTEEATRRSDSRTRALLKLRFEADLDRIENERMVKENEALQHEVARRRETESALRRIDEEKNALLRIVAHDLRSPAAAIRSMVDILDDPDIDSASRAEWLTEIRDTSEGMMDLVANLLDLERLRSGGSGPPLETVDLAQVLGDVARAGTPHAIRKDIRIEAVPPTEALIVRADAKGLRQCARNLLSNALKFSPPGKRVRLRAEPGESGADASLLVEDEGPGVAPADVPRLFTPFTRLSAQPTAGESSSGIGLSIVKKLMERMGGEIFYRHRDGGGAVFGLRLPKA